jgi:hypothetical protein
MMIVVQAVASPNLAFVDVLAPFFPHFLLFALVVGIGACTIKVLSGLRGFFR